MGSSGMECRPGRRAVPSNLTDDIHTRQVGWLQCLTRSRRSATFTPRRAASAELEISHFPRSQGSKAARASLTHACIPFRLMPWYRDTGKRACDVVLATLISVPALPVAVTCALAIRVIDGPPILFRQRRVGRGGVPFHILKFRTMKAEPGPQVTLGGDPRITRIGSLLRRTKLDELPQLWNVLRGEMSLVGPRPEMPGYVALYPRWFTSVLTLRPGITDYASIILSDEEQMLATAGGGEGFYRDVLLPRKLALTRLYRRRVSFRTDLLLILATALVGFSARRAAHWLLGQRFVDRVRNLRPHE